VTHLVLLAGMNDIAHSIAPGDVDPEFAGIMTTDAPVGTADVIAAYRQIIERAHAHGWQVRPASISATTCTATTPATGRWRTRSTWRCSTDGDRGYRVAAARTSEPPDNGDVSQLVVVLSPGGRVQRRETCRESSAENYMQRTLCKLC